MAKYKRRENGGIRKWVKEFYYLKIKKMTPREYLILHLRKTGMSIGENCYIFSPQIETGEPYLVTIGNNVLISTNVLFTTHDASASHYIPGSSDIFGRINIGDNCFIGMGVIILPGVTIAKDCIVGAGSVVTKSFLEPGMVIAGNPARVIGSIEDARNKNEQYALNVWNVPRADRKQYILSHELQFKGYTPVSNESKKTYC